MRERSDQTPARPANRILVPGLPGLLAILIMLAPLCAAAENSKAYTLGVFPHLPPRDLERVFAPLAADLGKKISGSVQLASSTTFSKFAANLDAEKYDVAFVQPFDYIRAARQHGYIPIATRTEKLAVIVVTRSDSPLTSLSDLRNKKVALPPATAAVSRLLRAHLKANGIDPDKDIQLVHYRTHFSCMQQVLIGEAVACGTAAPARRYFQSKYMVKLKIIAHSRDIPHSLWIVNPRVPAADREIIRKRILNWGNTADGQRLLADGKLKPFVPTKDSDYNIVRKMAGLAN